MSQNDDQEAQATSYRLVLHRYLSQITHFIDDNIRIIQGLTYAVAVAGVLRVLHSARAFTRFSRLEDIPPEFVYKNVQLRGVVRWVGTQPPSLTSPGSPTSPTYPAGGSPLLPSTGRTDKMQSVVADAGADVPPRSSSPGLCPSTGPSSSTPSATSSTPASTSPSTSPEADDAFSNAEYQRRRSDLARLRGSSLSSADQLAAVTPLYLLVEHVPVFRTPLQQSCQLLLISLAAVEVSEEGSAQCTAQLLHQRMWFRLYYLQAAPRLLACDVTLTSLGFKKWRTLNEDIVRRGNGVLSLVPDASAIEQLALYTPSLFERWQRTAVTWFKGPPPNTALARVDPSLLKEISLLPPSYYSLYEKIRKAEMFAQKRRFGVWKDFEGGAQGWFITRLWYRFRSYTRNS